MLGEEEKKRISAVEKLVMMILSPNIEDEKCYKWKQEEDQEGSFKEDSRGVKDGTEGRLGRRLLVERIPELGQLLIVTKCKCSGER